MTNCPYISVQIKGRCVSVAGEGEHSHGYCEAETDLDEFLFTKTNRCTNFPNLFCQESLHVSGSSSAHHKESSTVHSALVYVMQL